MQMARFKFKEGRGLAVARASAHLQSIFESQMIGFMGVPRECSVVRACFKMKGVNETLALLDLNAGEAYEAKFLDMVVIMVESENTIPELEEVPEGLPFPAILTVLRINPDREAHLKAIRLEKHLEETCSETTIADTKRSRL